MRIKFSNLFFLGVLILSLPAFAQNMAGKGEVIDESEVSLAKELETIPEASRDPFSSSLESMPVEASIQQPDALASPTQAFVLQGVAIGSRNATAVINGRTYTKGKNRDNILLVEVRKREADISVDGVLQTVRFPVSKVKKNNKKAILSKKQESNPPEPHVSAEATLQVEKVPMISKEESK